jgi:hypothetical protein
MTVEAETELCIDAARLWQSLMDLASIGATPLGGVRRITLTDLDRDAAQHLLSPCPPAFDALLEPADEELIDLDRCFSGSRSGATIARRSLCSIIHARS